MSFVRKALDGTLEVVSLVTSVARGWEFYDAMFASGNLPDPGCFWMRRAREHLFKLSAYR